MKIYKIKNLKTGEYSNGGSRPSFNKKGKNYNHIGHAKRSITSSDSRNDWKDCAIVECEMIETVKMPVEDVLIELKLKLNALKMEKEKEKEEKLRIKEQDELETFERLKKKYAPDGFEIKTGRVLKRQVQKLTGQGLEFQYYCSNCYNRITPGGNKCSICGIILKGDF